LGLISQHSIDDVIRANDIVDVVSRYVRLEKKSGLNLFGLCPFHDEKTPSFSVVPSKQIFYCFGCHKGGNVIKFIQEIEHISYPEAIRLLADQAGVVLDEEESDGQWKIKRERRQQAMSALLEAARYFYSTLESPEGQPAREYLARRGIDRGIYRSFGLGFALDRWDGLFQHLKEKGFEESAMTDAGLIRRSSQGNWIDFFRGRVMFPVIDLQGRILAFGGRRIEDDGPKYINSPETLVYQKGKHLFGWPQAQRARSEEMIVVEGYMDVIALARAGVRNVVAPLGTALTPYQAQLLGRTARNVLLLFDADRAGTEAALRAHEVLQQANVSARFVLLDGAKDPDDYLNRFGKGRLVAALAESLDVTGYQLALLAQEQKEIPLLPENETRNRALSILSEEPDGVTRELYARRLGERWRLSSKTIMEEVERRRTQRRDDKMKVSNVDYRDSRSPKSMTHLQQRRAPAQTSEDNHAMNLMALLVTEPSLIKERPRIEESMLEGFSLSTAVREMLLSDDTRMPLQPADFSPGALRQLALSMIDSAADGTLTMATFLARVDQLDVQDDSNKKKTAENVEALRRAFLQTIKTFEKMRIKPDDKRRLYKRALLTMRAESWENDASMLNDKGSEMEISGQKENADRAFSKAAELMMSAQIMRTILQGEQ
jgi:DNA primase